MALQCPCWELTLVVVVVLVGGDDGDESDWEDPVYVPDRVRQQIYFLWAHKGMSIPELAQRFGIRTERISAFILLKRTEPEMAAKGMVSEEPDRIMEALYGPEAVGQTRPRWNEKDDFEQGLDVAVLKDAQLPEDCFPVMKFRGHRLRVAYPTPPVPLPPIDQRRHHSRFAIRDISAGDSGLRSALARHVVIDHDGTRRMATKREELYRAPRIRRAYVKRNGYGSGNLPVPDAELDKP